MNGFERFKRENWTWRRRDLWGFPECKAAVTTAFLETVPVEQDLLFSWLGKAGQLGCPCRQGPLVGPVCSHLSGPVAAWNEATLANVGAG